MSKCGVEESSLTLFSTRKRYINKSEHNSNFFYSFEFYMCFPNSSAILPALNLPNTCTWGRFEYIDESFADVST